MIKKSFVYTTRPIYRSKGVVSLAQEIMAINDICGKLDKMVETNDYAVLMEVVYEMGHHFNKGLRRAKDEESLYELTNVYSAALEKLHDTIFEREKDALYFHANHLEDCRPITQRSDTRCIWDGDEYSWENPSYERMYGFARVMNRNPPLHAIRKAVNVERYAKFSLIALIEETEKLARIPLNEARDSVAAFVDIATQFYERIRTGWYDARSQISLVYFQAITAAIKVSNRIGTGESGFCSVRGLMSLNYDSLFWFRMPEYPSPDDEEGVERFIVESEREIKLWMDRLCSASADLFCRWIYQASACVEKCVAYIAESKHLHESKAAELLVVVTTKVVRRVADADLEKGAGGSLTIPLGDCTGYSLSNTIFVMQRLAKNATRRSRGTRTAALARKLREITLEFSVALNFEWYKRSMLIATYADCLSIVRKKAIAEI